MARGEWRMGYGLEMRKASVILDVENEYGVALRYGM